MLLSASKLRLLNLALIAANDEPGFPAAAEEVSDFVEGEPLHLLHGFQLLRRRLRLIEAVAHSAHPSAILPAAFDLAPWPEALLQKPVARGRQSRSRLPTHRCRSRAAEVLRYAPPSPPKPPSIDELQRSRRYNQRRMGKDHLSPSMSRNVRCIVVDFVIHATADSTTATSLSVSAPLWRPPALSGPPTGRSRSSDCRSTRSRCWCLSRPGLRPETGSIKFRDRACPSRRDRRLRIMARG
jgi:hypothetical protein